METNFFEKWSADYLSSRNNLKIIFWLRNIAIIGQSSMILLVIALFKIPLPVVPMFVIITIEVIINITTAIRLTRDWPVTELEILTHLFIDSLFLASLIYFSGGSSNPFIYLLLIPTALATIAISPLKVIILALIQIAFYSLLMKYRFPLIIPEVSQLDNFHIHLVGMWINFILSTLLIASFGLAMSRHINVRDRRLQNLREQQLREEQVLSLGIISAGAAHELSTPLSTMSLIAEDLLSHCESQPESEDLQLLNEQITRCKNIIHDLGEISSQFNLEQMPPRPLGQILEQIIDRWQVTRPEINIILSWPKPCSTRQLSLNISFDQALTNLLNNAADASVENGRHQVEISSTCENNHLLIDIRDYGKGISAELKQTLGRTLIQSEKTGGLGWGWLLTNASIERLGGQVQLLAAPECGTIVRVSIDMAP